MRAHPPPRSRSPKTYAGDAADRLRLHAGGPGDPDRARWPRPARSRPARWAPTGALPALSDKFPAAVRLLQAALRAGHEPGDRLAARGPGDEPDDVARARAGAAGGRAGARPAVAAAEPGADHRREVARVSASPLPWVPLDATWPVSLGGRPGWKRVSSDWWPRRPRPRHPARTSSCSATAASGPGRAPIPFAAGRRRRAPRGSSAPACAPAASLVVDSGEPREVHHVACLVGYGADAVHPWLAGDEIVPALEKGLLKAMSKMGVSTVSAYRGAQVFEAVGLGPELIERHFVGHAVKARRARAARARARGARAPRAHVPAGRRALPLAPRRRAPRLEPGHGRRACSAASGGATSRRPTRPPPGALRGQLAFRDATRSRWRVEPATRDHEALRDRRDVARVDLTRGPRVAGDRDERDRRALEHRRGRRGPGALRPTTRRSAIKQVA